MTRFTKIMLCVVALALPATAAAFFAGAYPQLLAAMAPDRPFDEIPAASLDEANQRLGALDETTRQLYRRHLVTDVPFFMANAIFVGALLLLALGPYRPSWARALILIPPLLAVLGDIGENAALASWFSERGPSSTSVSLAWMVNKIKFGGLIIAPAVLLIAIACRFIFPARPRASQTVLEGQEDAPCEQSP